MVAEHDSARVVAIPSKSDPQDGRSSNLWVQSQGAINDGSKYGRTRRDSNSRGAFRAYTVAFELV